MAADPGSSSASYHLFLTRIPPKLPKEEVEAALAAELSARRVDVLSVTVVPQSAWKNKGFGFVVLSGSPNGSEIAAIAAQLDNNIRVGGKALNVRVCQAPVSGGKPAVLSGPLNSWDQPSEKITRLCAQVLHCYFARRAHQEAYKAEKLLALLSATVAPSCSQEPRPLSLWGRDIYGSLEAMLLAIGVVHFGGSWSLTGTIAERSAILSVGKARHMQGWDALRDPLPIATLLRLAACKQRLEDIHTPEASSGFSTPTVCRRCSDCGSLSAMHSTEQPSCSQSEASWSLRSLYVAAAASATETTTSSSEATSSLGTPSNGSEGTTLSSSTSATPVSWGSCKSLERCTGGSEAVDTGQQSKHEPRPPDPSATASTSSKVCGGDCGAEGEGGCRGSSGSRPADSYRGDSTEASPMQQPAPVAALDARMRARDAQQQQVGRVMAEPEASSSGRAPDGPAPGASTGVAGRSQQQQQPQQQRHPQQQHLGRHSARTSTLSSPLPEPQQHQHQQPHRHQSQHHTLIPGGGSCCVRHRSAAAASAASSSTTSVPPAWTAPASRPTAQPLQGITALMPTAQDLMGRCANHLKLLFARNPGQDMFIVADLAQLLSEAPDVVAWGSGAPYFSLEGYAHAVYGSFERFLLEISRLYFGGRWFLEGGHRTGELRVLCLSACGMRSACSTPGPQQGGSAGSRGSSVASGVPGSAAASAAAAFHAVATKGKARQGRGSGSSGSQKAVAPRPPRVPDVAGAVIAG